MRFPLVFALGSVVPVFAQDAASAAWSRFANLSAQALNQYQHDAADDAPLPPDTTALAFRDFFAPVVGDLGLTYSEKLRSLDGRRVRIAGFMTREPQRHAGFFLLTAQPSQVVNDGFCVWDDLPPATLHVLMPAAAAGEVVPYVPGRLVLEGTLEVGAQPMGDGRNSVARLRLDTVPWAAGDAGR